MVNIVENPRLCYNQFSVKIGESYLIIIEGYNYGFFSITRHNQ